MIFGGKNQAYVWRKIVREIPPHSWFGEFFSGSAPLTFHKRPAAQNFLVDIDPAACAAAQLRLTAGSGNEMDFPRHLRVIEGDVLRWLSPDSWLRAGIRREGEKAVAYFDPPYLLDARSTPRERYKFEFCTAEQHTELLQLVKRLECHVIISHYRHALYEKMLKGWRRVDFLAMTRRGQKRTESIYCNFAEPPRVHDWQGVGGNKDRNQRIARITSRTLAQLKQLPAREAYAVAAAVAVEFDCFAERPIPRGQLPVTAGTGSQ